MSRETPSAWHKPRIWIGRPLRWERWEVRLSLVVLFFEFMLVAAVVVITWFALYALYRLVTDES